MSQSEVSLNMLISRSSANGQRGDFLNAPPTRSRATSVTSASSLVPDPVVCDVCQKEYSGEYRRGNLSRHKRQKHGVVEQVYSCEEPDCVKEFRRQDARLKHYRRCHPHLVLAPLVPRH